MSFALENLGRWTAEREYVVTPEAIKAYAEATNDELPAHRNGVLAPPMFAVVPALMNVATTAMRDVWRSEVEGYDTRSMHGEHDLVINKPILPGQTLCSRAAAVGLVSKSSGTLLVTRTETRNERTLMNTMTFINFLRGVHTDASVGEDVPTLGASPASQLEPFATLEERVDADQSFRYAEASGDYGTYHVDAAAANAAGFPGVIVHGLCTMAFAAKAIVHACCDDDSTKLKRLGVRFTSPLLPNQEITTRIYRDRSDQTWSSYTFEVDDSHGEAVIRRGIAEVTE